MPKKPTTNQRITLATFEIAAQDGDEVKTMTGAPLHCGTFTIVAPDGRRATIKISQWREKGGGQVNTPGKWVASFLRGSDNEADYTPFAFIGPSKVFRIWKKFSGSTNLRFALQVLCNDPAAAGLAYALRSGKCCVCGRTLTVPDSIHASMGPICAARIYGG